MHGATRTKVFRIALAVLLCRAAFAAEEPTVEKKAQAATQIYVRTAPPGAAVRLNGKEEGTAPGLFVVPPGVTKMTVEVELEGAKDSRVIEVRGGKITRVEFELATEGAQPISEAPVPASGARRAEGAAEREAIRGLIARFVALARSGDKDKAIAETFAKDADGPSESVAVFLGAVAARVDPTRIWCIAYGKDGAAVVTRHGADKTAGALCYNLDAHPGGWRIDEIVLRSGENATLIPRDAPPPFDVTLEFELSDPERRHAELLDLDTGEFATMEEFGADDRATHAWVREHGMDALGVIEKGTAGVLLFDVATLDIPPEKWSTITAEEIANNPTLKQKEPDKITPLPREPSSSVPTCIFRTREGAQGVLQVLGASEAPKGVVIRYRLANGPQHLARTDMPEDPRRRFVRVVIGNDAMTFEGAPVSWEQLPQLLQAVPNHGSTVLELAADSADLPMSRMNEARARLSPLVREQGFEYLSLVGVHPLDSKGTSTAVRGRLDLRLAPMREEGKLLGLTESDIERYTAELKAKGPLPATYGKDPFVWCRLSKAVAPPERCIRAERAGNQYVLLSNRPAETMLTLWGDSNPWRLLDATADASTPDRPQIALRLDKEGGWRMGALTEAHVGWPMAALVDDEVLSMPVVRSRVADAIMITGLFTKEEVAELVERLKGGVSR
jgi:hypothetical protein